MADGMQVGTVLVEGLALMRKPFEPHQISKLPKPTKRQTEIVKNDYKQGIRCKICGGWHHPDVIHLDYVGHAALTDRLLECDPTWNWEPCAVNADGTPSFDENGGLWIRLTVCGVTRNGYGHADGKQGGNAIKEAIGDALRNAAMRFGAALDLWHNGELHIGNDDEGDDAPPQKVAPAVEVAPPAAQRLTNAQARDMYDKMLAGLRGQRSARSIRGWLDAFERELASLPESWEREIRTEAQQEIEAHETSEPQTEGPF
ncbi:MAG: hypothetical protein AAGF20_00250 [Pseudomonadota bacterium]